MTYGVFTARFILFGLVVAQLADAFTFTYGVSRFGIHLESNGIAAGIFHAGGLDAVLLVKGAVIVVTTVLLAYTAHRYPRLLVWGGATATSMGLLGFAANSASIAILS
jgi:Ni,Fe-hydrogenase III small subunit